MNNKYLLVSILLITTKYYQKNNNKFLKKTAAATRVHLLTQQNKAILPPNYDYPKFVIEEERGKSERVNERAENERGGNL